MSRARFDDILSKKATVLNSLNMFGEASINGAPLLGMLANSNIYWCDPSNGDDDFSGKTPDQAKATLLAAYNLTTANQHDIVVLVGGASGLNLSAALVWANSYTHLIGVCAPTHVGQRARIFQLSTLVGASPLITVSGSGCMFKDLYIFQGVADATSLINVSVTGSRNYFENVHFAGGGNATQAIDGGASLLLNGGSENLFRHCTIGVDTIAAATGMTGLLVDTAAARNKFEDCLFTMYAGHAGCSFVEIADDSGMDRYLIFDRCTFINDAVGFTMASGLVIPGSMHSVTNFIILRDSFFLGVTDIDASDRGVVYADKGTLTGGGNAGLLIVSAAA